MIQYRSIFVYPRISDCAEQEKAIAQIASLVDISLMIETNDDPITDAANNDDLKEMFRSTMAIRYGISGPTKNWNFESIQNNIQSVQQASQWIPDNLISKSAYQDKCSAWRPLEERNSLQENAETCFDECAEFQRWIKEEIESNNLYNSLSQYKGKIETDSFYFPIMIKNVFWVLLRAFHITHFLLH